ncbi:dienelactone hydrolase family protein [Sinomicrobium weinanense]|uniref:Dienelactone hydrolase family protein n=1 Tax=Sinomicrobium weinanense TaxID=2842200 RepID=A0A926JW00_9FLAO|nr:dienelactone hydrolase family protein [Sinomicrobium weinanense]MBC9798344.1 dienelactone hydrolase family protein [Sinomicrobium weinanense]MBU3122509.1 dienelactone hydrolase family protein [Sinomicrobium weinanense]
MKKIIVIMTLIGALQTTVAQGLALVEYADDTQKLNGLVTGNSGKKSPGVLVLPAWMGIDNEARTAALNLEKEGYIAFVADIYGEGNVPANRSEAGKIATAFKTDYALYQKRIQLALDQLQKAGADPDKLAVIGYCFGGTGALEAARGNLPVSGAVSIHGGLGKDATRANVALKPKILVLHGADDASASEQILKDFRTELDEGKADWQMIYYANSKHTFTNPESPDYNEIMSKRSWRHTLMFLQELFDD